MNPYTRLLFKGFLISVFAILIHVGASYAHHSFAPYDIRNAIEVAGVAEEFEYIRPHPMLSLVDEEGVSWEIEVPIRRWEQAGFAPDLIEPGDQLVVRVFPARDRSPNAAMSGFEKDGTYYTVTDEVRQQSGNAAADAIERGEPVEEVLERYARPDNEGAEAIERSAPLEEVLETSAGPNFVSWGIALAAMLVIAAGLVIWKRK